MRFLFRLLVFLSLLKFTSSNICDGTVLSKAATSIGYVNGKCLAVTSAVGTVASACRGIGSGVTYNPISIDNVSENEKVKEGLLEADVTLATICLVQTDSQWTWANNDPSTYRNWENPPITDAPTVPVTTSPIRTTFPPDKQRRSTAVVIAIDASLYSTNALTFAQVQFVHSLSMYIADRGYAEFAFFAYGCTQITPFTSQYPTFVNTFEATEQMILNLNETINHDCTRTNPLDFKTMFRDQTLYYNRYSSSIRPFKSEYLSMIYFSASTDSDNIKSASALYPMLNSSIITINIGDSSIDISSYSIPAGKNGLRVKTSDDILSLVPKIDGIIFGTSGVQRFVVPQEEEEEEKEENIFEPIIDATVQPCAFMNSTDGLWYIDSVCNKRQVVCQYVPPTPAPPPTENPTMIWSDPCFKDNTNFTFFTSLNNTKCYRVSSEKKQFSEAENECLHEHPVFLHTPKLTSIETQLEEGCVRTLVSPITTEGMFWFGLKRDNSSSNWYYINGDTFDGTSHANWRSGYPRDADGCDCVALVINDNSWVNTDCNKSLYSICAFRFDTPT